MFRSQINSDEESILVSLLEGESLGRGEVLIRIKETYNQTTEEESREIVKRLFVKVQQASDHEYSEFIKSMI